MYTFKVNDTVTFLFNRKECHGTIRKIGKKNAEVLIDALYDELYEIKKIPLERLTYVPPVVLSNKQVRDLCRYNVKWSDLKEGYPNYAPVFLENPYTITFEDILDAVHNISVSGDDNDIVAEEWYYPLYEFMFEYEEAIKFEETPDDVIMLEYLPNRTECIFHIFYTELDTLLYDKDLPIVESIADIAKEIEHITEDEQKPILERSYTDDDKEHYISSLGKDERLKKATESELEVYRSFIQDLIPKNNHTALKLKGYGCYGGDPAYECDWNTSLECVTKLYELTGKPVYANTLGYIYYYGRCWDGKPKYDEAFKFFSIGAAGFYYESRYKLADMFVHGYGIPKNTKVAFTIVSELYDQNLPYILDGKFDCKFADIALRLGSYTENGYGGYVSEYNAYKYYLQADFAIRQRLKYDHYGDLSVADSIQKRLNNIIKSGKVDRPRKTTNVDLSLLLSNYLKKYRKLQMKIQIKKNGSLKLTIRIAPFEDEKYHPKMFITEPDTGFCGLLETITLRVKKGEIIEPESIDKPIYFDDVYSYYEPVSQKNSIGFSLGDRVQAIINGIFNFKSPIKSSEKKYIVASVYFSLGGKQYDYFLDLKGVKVGDKVYVMTSNGRTKVTVASIAEKSESELTLPIDRYKKIIGKE